MAREGLKMPSPQLKKCCLWPNGGPCVQLRPIPEPRKVHHRTDDGKVFRTLNIIDEHSRERLAIKVKRRLNSIDVIDSLIDLFILHGVPVYIRSDNGLSSSLRLSVTGSRRSVRRSPEPGGPWENGYCESFNARFRDELLYGEVFYTLTETQTIIRQWGRHYKTKRPHSSLGYCPPAPEIIVPMDRRPPHALTFIMDHLKGAGHDLGKEGER